MSNFTIVAPYFWPETIGSAPYCTDLADWLSARGHQISIITHRPHYPKATDFPEWCDGSRDYEYRNKILISRSPITSSGAGSTLGRVGNDSRFLLSVIRASLSSQEKCDAVLVFVPSTLGIFGAKLAALLSHARLVCVVHDIESGLVNSLRIGSKPGIVKAIRLVERLAFKLPDEVVVLTKSMAEELVRLGCRKPISVLPIWAQSVCHDFACPPEPPVVAYSGNFGKKQNLYQLLPLIRSLNKEMPNVQVHLRGEGSERGKLETAVAELGVSNTSFLPLVPKDELLSTIQASTLQLVPQADGSANYAFPSKLISIMSAGRPFVCIAEKNSAVDVVTNESGGGICVPPNNEKALLEAVRSILKCPKRMVEMGRAGLNYVSANNNASTILQKYEQMLDPIQRRDVMTQPVKPT